MNPPDHKMIDRNHHRGPGPPQPSPPKSRTLIVRRGIHFPTCPSPWRIPPRILAQHAYVRVYKIGATKLETSRESVITGYLKLAINKEKKHDGTDPPCHLRFLRRCILPYRSWVSSTKNSQPRPVLPVNIRVFASRLPRTTHGQSLGELLLLGGALQRRRRQRPRYRRARQAPLMVSRWVAEFTDVQIAALLHIKPSRPSLHIPSLRGHWDQGRSLFLLPL